MVPNTVYHYNDTYYWLETVIDEETKQPKTDSNGNILYSATLGITVPTNMLTYTSLAIKHEELNTEIIIANNKPNGIVVIDGANRLAYDKSHPSRVLGDDFSWNWIGLQEGKNTLSFVGNGIVTIEYREPIKCGEF